MEDKCWLEIFTNWLCMCSLCRSRT